MLTSRIHHGLALASAATLLSLSCGALAGAATADPKPGHTDHGKHLGQVKDQPNGPKKGPKPGHQDHGHGHAHGHSTSHATGHATAPGQQAAHGNPPGNNGTVKIAGPGDAVGHPSNNPHPGCTFYVEWFGFDEGQDVVSTVTFAPQAPTSDVTIGGAAPGQVFVGGDPAGGGTDLDGRQAYTLTFTGGAPHPKQGYHVKLTVATPHSLGNDTKTKVFWVAPCATDTTTAQGASSHHAAGGRGHENGGRGHGNGDRGVEASTLSAPAADTADTDTDTDVAAGTATAGVAVPTSVDAGEDGSVLPDWARSPWPLVAVAGGLTVAGAALTARRKRRA